MSIPGNMIDELILETIPKHVKNKKAFGSSQHRFMQSESSLTNLIGFYDQITSLVNKGWYLDVVNLNFSKAFMTVSPIISA